MLIRYLNLHSPTSGRPPMYPVAFSSEYRTSSYVDHQYNFTHSGTAESIAAGVKQVFELSVPDEYRNMLSQTFYITENALNRGKVMTDAAKSIMNCYPLDAVSWPSLTLANGYVMPTPAIVDGPTDSQYGSFTYYNAPFKIGAYSGGISAPYSGITPWGANSVFIRIPLFPLSFYDEADKTFYVPDDASYFAVWNYLQFSIHLISGTTGYVLIRVQAQTNYPVSASDVTDLRLFTNTPTFDPIHPATPDPYTGAGYPASTAPGGPSGGSFDFTDDPITGVHTPGLDLLNSGLITAWRPSKATLVQLANWLWVTTPGQVIQQLFGNPINAIIGLNIVPVSPPVDGGLNTIKFGNDDSGVACPKITSQHVTVDCGSITVDPIYGSYMDYAPQTSAELFLPYVGGLPLDVNDVVGKTISVQYEVDVLSGACVAYVFIDGGLHYQKAGSCAATAPITGSQMPNVVAGVLSIAGSVAGFVASAGASGASTAAKVASGIATGTSVAESAANMLKQSISYSGTISGWAGLLGSQKPYLLLSVPHVAMPGGQNALMGYPAWVSGRVGDFTGYTECTVDRVTATRATDKEVEEIKSLLEGGVIL